MEVLIKCLFQQKVYVSKIAISHEGTYQGTIAHYSDIVF